MKTFQITYNPKLTSILIIGFCLLRMFIGNYVERFRISNYRWVYEYGKLVNLIMVLTSISWSFFHPLIVWSTNKPKWKKNMIWMIIGLIPIIYFMTLMIIA